MDEAVATLSDSQLAAITGALLRSLPSELEAIEPDGDSEGWDLQTSPPVDALSDDEMAAISALQSANSRICDFDFSPGWD